MSIETSSLLASAPSSQGMTAGTTQESITNGRAITLLQDFADRFSPNRVRDDYWCCTSITGLFAATICAGVPVAAGTAMLLYKWNKYGAAGLIQSEMPWALNLLFAAGGGIVATVCVKFGIIGCLQAQRQKTADRINEIITTLQQREPNKLFNHAEFMTQLQATGANLQLRPLLTV